MRRKGIGSHAKQGKGKTVIWLTPPEVISVLGAFDLDPCAAPSPRPWSTASRHIELPEDGLQAHWHGRIWLNPPYDESLARWMRKIAEHQSGIALVFARTETEVWQDWIWPFAHSILFPQGRFWFRKPDGSLPKANAGGPSALISYSAFDTAVLQASGIKGSIQKRV